MTNEFKLPPFTVQNEINPNEIPWGVKHIGAETAWKATKGKDVVVAVLDTGCDATHPDLVGRVIDGKNFTTDYNGDSTNYHDNQGHGTHCAGVIAGNINNNGIIGVAPETKLIIGKVLTSNGSGDYSSIINGIKWATNWVGPNGERTRIISMSLGGPSNVAALYQAITEAVSAGISVVCASGNNGDGSSATNEYNYPGAYGVVIEVGATDENDAVARFSNSNNRLDIVAPGVNILSTMPDGKWARMNGTSMATPHVAGALALIYSAFEADGTQLTEAQAFEILVKHTRKIEGHVNSVGNGILDLSVSPFPVTEPAPVEPEPVKVELSVVSEDSSFFINIGPYDSKEVAEQKLLEIAETFS